MELDFQQNSVKFKVIKWLKDAQRYETMLKMEFDDERDSAESRVKKWLEDLHIPKTVIDVESDEECDSPKHKVVNWLQGIQTYSSEKMNSSCVSDLSNDSVGEKSSSFESSDNMSLREGRVSSNPRRHKDNCDSSVETSSESRCSINLVRRPYVFSERMSIINFIAKFNLFQQIKGNMLWQKMENKKVCSSRSWQSMKSHFLNYILPNIDNFPISDLVKNKFQELTTASTQKESAIMQPYQRGWREKVNYYTFAEDIDLLKYILHRRRYKRTNGKSLWMKMCKRKLLPGRSWQSLRSRFFTILPYLSTYKLHQEDIKKLLSPSVNSKSPRKIGLGGRLLPLHEDRVISMKRKLNFINEETEVNASVPEVLPLVTTSKNVKPKQQIAKMALNTGIALAAHFQSIKSSLPQNKESSQNKHIPNNCKTLEKHYEGNCKNSNGSLEINELNADNLKVHTIETDRHACNATMDTVTSSSKDVSSTSKGTSLVTRSSVATQIPDVESGLLNKREGIFPTSCSSSYRTPSNEESKPKNISNNHSNCTPERQDEAQTSRAEIAGSEDVVWEVENMYDDNIVLCWESVDSDLDV